MAIKQVRVKINNAWTVLTYNINDGHYYPVTVEATNMAGTVSTKDDTDVSLGSSLRLRVKEQTAPVISITSPTASAFLATNTPDVEFTVVDENNGSGVDISSLKIKVDSQMLTNTSAGVTVSTITNGYSIKYVPQMAFSDGVHKVTVNCSDHDGNSATEKSVSFTVDTVAPTLTVTQPKENGTYVASAIFTVKGTTNDVTSSVASVVIKLNGADQGDVAVDSAGSFEKTVTLKEGGNTIEVTANDRAGKTTTVSRTILLDLSVPNIETLSIAPNPVNTGKSFVISVKVN